MHAKKRPPGPLGWGKGAGPTASHFPYHTTDGPEKQPKSPQNGALAGNFFRGGKIWREKSGKGFSKQLFCTIIKEKETLEELTHGEKGREKRRIRLEINGVVCWLITQESDEYMQSLAKEVGELLEEMQITSPYITREAAALAAALGYCDDARKNGQRASRLQERVDELEVEAEVWQEEKEELLKNPPVKPDPEMAKRLAFFEEENTRLTAQVQELQQLREKAAALGDENQALREQLAALERAGGGEAPARPAEDSPRLAQLTEENRTLREQVQEQEELARQAVREKQGAVAAAKRAVEEARRTMDQMEQEADQAKQELKQLQERGVSPALDLLERTAEENQEKPVPQSEEEDPRSASKTRKKRKNPLRYEEEYEQEGFVSFFEKK